MEEVTSWIEKSLGTVMETEDQILGTRAFWCDWAAVQRHFPAKFRNGTVKLLDRQLQARGRPSLRDLVSIQDGDPNLQKALFT